MIPMFDVWLQMYYSVVKKSLQHRCQTAACLYWWPPHWAPASELYHPATVSILTVSLLSTGSAAPPASLQSLPGCYIWLCTTSELRERRQAQLQNIMAQCSNTSKTLYLHQLKKCFFYILWDQIRPTNWGCTHISCLSISQNAKMQCCLLPGKKTTLHWWAAVL